jgi:hypothetical protein
VHRFRQFALLATLLPLCWLLMMAVHELGHAVAGWASGGSVAKVVIHPLSISRTDVIPNPHPLVVVWAGPFVGSVLPLLVWWCGRRLKPTSPYLHLFRFFAGFCLVANGAYIGGGSFDPVADPAEMMRHGSPVWSLWVFGACAISLGLYLWHGLGPHFGLGAEKREIEPRVVYGSAALLLIVAVSSALFSPRI